MAPSASLEISYEETQKSLLAPHYVPDTVDSNVALNEVTIPNSHTFRSILVMNLLLGNSFILSMDIISHTTESPNDVILSYTAMLKH